MFGIRKNTTATKYINSPETWLPTAMRDRLADAAVFRESLSPLTERNWHERLEQTEFIGNGRTRVDIELSGPYLQEVGEPHSAEDVHALTQAIMSDPVRKWSAYVTIRTQEYIAGVIAQEKADAEAGRRRIQFHQCPVCSEFSDVSAIGPVKSRALPTSAGMRSCEACHAVASAHLVERFGMTRLDDGRSRAEVIRDRFKTLAPSA